VQKLKMNKNVPPLSHMSSWNAQGQLYLYLYLQLGFIEFFFSATAELHVM
jgi:hypothetical protein